MSRTGHYRESKYYEGQNMARSARPSYDDEKGQYVMTIGDHIAHRYEILKVLGKGSFSTVVKVLDHKHRDLKAIKVIRNEESINRHAYQEIDLLNKLQGQHNSLSLLAHFTYRNHLCMVTELFSINLWQVLKLNQLRGLPMQTIKSYAEQLLDCLAFLSTQRVIHCDLKPENIILLEPDSPQIKVVDFGSSAFTNGKLFTYIQSRYYRAPEVIMELPYDCSIDMWSMGCILVELYTGRPLFPGKTEEEQVRLFEAVLGPCPPALVQRSRRTIRNVLGDAQTRLPRSSLAHVVGNSDPDFLSFIQATMTWDKRERLTPTQALRHPWLTGGSSRRGPSQSQMRMQSQQQQQRPGRRVQESPFVPPTPMSYVNELNKALNPASAYPAPVQRPQEQWPQLSSRVPGIAPVSEQSYASPSSSYHSKSQDPLRSNGYQNSRNGWMPASHTQPWAGSHASHPSNHRPHSHQRAYPHEQTQRAQQQPPVNTRNGSYARQPYVASTPWATDVDGQPGGYSHTSSGYGSRSNRR